MSSLEVTECDNRPLTAALASNDNDAGIFLSLTSSSAESDLSNTSLPQQLPSRHDPPGSFAWKRWILLLVLLLGIVYVVLDSTIGGGNVERIILGFLDWVERNPIRGALCVCIVYIFATILFVPGSIMTLGAGYALGSAVPGPMGVLLATAVRTIAPNCCTKGFSLSTLMIRSLDRLSLWELRLVVSVPFCSVDTSFEIASYDWPRDILYFAPLTPPCRGTG